nr:hypothetical protein [Tanacetum cinerariifolium]
MTYPCHWFSEQVGLAGDLGLTNDVLNPLEECPENLGSGEAKYVKKPSQAPRGVPDGLKVVFKPEKVGFGTNSLLKQWKDSYENADYNYDPYDDDMYDG